MELEQAAACLAELGNAHRLGIYRYLVKAGPEGAMVGDIQRALAIPGSTLSHHLSRMANVGLIHQDKQSRSIYCQPNYAKLDELIAFLQEECCQGHC